jgi:probable F420-dependent oxidoreductase
MWCFCGIQDMNIGFHLGHQTQQDGDGLRRIARAVDEAGFHSLWVSEHIAVPLKFESKYLYSGDFRPRFPDDGSVSAAMVTLAHVAAVTDQVRLASGVIPMFCHNPIALAKEAASVDRLSNGRLELGVGAGWLVEEAEMLGNPTDHRGARLDEAIEIMQKAWGDPPFKHDGRFWKVPLTSVCPGPVQGPRLPIWVGGSGPARIRTAVARGATGVYLAAAETAKVGQIRAVLPGDKRIAIGVRIESGFEIHRSREEIEAIFEAGADLVVVLPNQFHDDANSTIAIVDRFASELLAEFANR